MIYQPLSESSEDVLGPHREKLILYPRFREFDLRARLETLTLQDAVQAKAQGLCEEL